MSKHGGSGIEVIELRVKNLEEKTDSNYKRIEKNASGVYRIDLEINTHKSDIAYLKKVVFPTVAFILFGVLSVTGSAVLFFLMQ